MRITTPFIDRHLRHGARMQSLRDWWLPAFYTSVDEEYWQVRRAAGFVDYSFQSAIQVSGRDALLLLQGVLVNDLGRIEPGRALYSTILESCGKFADDVVVFWMDENRFIVNGSPAPRKSLLISLLRSWSQGLEVAITDLDTCFLALQGPKSREILGRALDVAAMPFMAVRNDRLDGLPVIVARTGYSGELGFEIYVSPEHAGALWDRLLELGRGQNLVPYGASVTALLSVEKGLLAPPDFYAGATPLELGLGWSVAFDKPDFNGRAELLRRKAAGLQTRLMGFEVEDHAIRSVPGTRLFRGMRPVGSVTYGNLFGPSIGRNAGRCWIDSRYAQVGEELEMEYLGERKQVRLTGFRHYDPQGERLRS